MSIVQDHIETETFEPTLKGVPIEQPPGSIEEAVEIQAELLNDLRAIDGQLGQLYIERDGKRLNQRDYAEWRRKALVARRLTERRYRFIKQWIKDNGNGAVHSTIARERYGKAAVAEIRDLAKRVGGIESIAIAAVDFVRDRSDENLSRLVELVDRHGDQVGV